VTDVVIVLAAPENSLGLALGRGDGTFRDTIDWIRGVSPVHPDELLIRDVDHDGLADITFVDSLRGEVVTLYGLGGGKFALPATICQAEGVTHIAVASIKSAPSDDLVLVHRDQAVVSIQFSAFRKTAR
jgi:hypothetical protein